MTIAEILTFIGFVFANIFLETTVVVNINLFGILPDTIVAATVAIALVKGGIKGTVYGASCGMLIDILFGSVLGLHTIAYMLIGFFASRFSREYYADNLVFPALAAFVSYFIKELIIAVSLIIQNVSFSKSSLFLRFLLPAAVLTALLTVPMYYFYRQHNRHELRRMKYR